MSHTFRLTRLLPRFLRNDKDKTNSSKTPDVKNGPVCKVIFLDEIDQLFPFKVCIKIICILKNTVCGQKYCHM